MHRIVETDPQRLRAARGWAGLSQTELGKRLGRSKLYVGRREKAPDEKGAYPMSEADRIAVAHLCGLPLQWFYVDIIAAIDTLPLPTPAEVDAREALREAEEAARQLDADTPRSGQARVSQSPKGPTPR
jgi:transcriptional regulator with XRE-family HTH domain